MEPFHSRWCQNKAHDTAPAAISARLEPEGTGVGCTLKMWLTFDSTSPLSAPDSAGSGFASAAGSFALPAV